MCNRLSAKDACILAYSAVEAGANGPAAKLAKPPGDPSTGHFSKHFDRVCGADLEDPTHYTLQVPMYNKAEGSRAPKPLACMPAHESLAREVAADPHFGEKLEGLAATLPP